VWKVKFVEHDPAQNFSTFNKNRNHDGPQCRKQSYLLTHRPEYKTPINTPAMITGVVVEEHAKRFFSNGVLLERGAKSRYPLENTKTYFPIPLSTLFFRQDFWMFYSPRRCLEFLISLVAALKLSVGYLRSSPCSQLLNGLNTAEVTLAFPLRMFAFGQ